MVKRLTSLRQYQGEGKSAPHKPLLVLLALGQLTATGSSNMSWSDVETRLNALLAEFGTSKTSGATSAAYPLTRLRADGVWVLSREVEIHTVGSLNAAPVDGHFPGDVEAELLRSPETLTMAAPSLVESQFPFTLASDVLTAVGLDPDVVLITRAASAVEGHLRKRNVNWRKMTVAAWDRSCVLVAMPNCPWAASRTAHNLF